MKSINAVMQAVGWVWIIIGVVAVFIILWVPSKIPDLAKAIGRAKSEFNQASKEINEAANLAEHPAPAAATPAKTHQHN